MTTLTTTRPITATVQHYTLAELEETVTLARENMIAAWKVQSRTTADEGYTIPQANEAINQALDAEAVYGMHYDLLNERKARMIDLALEAEWREAECTCTPLDPMACPTCCDLLDEGDLPY